MTFDRITFNPKQMSGKPCIRGMRLTVGRVLDILATYGSFEEAKAEFPELEDEDIRQAIYYASALLEDRVIDTDSVPVG